MTTLAITPNWKNKTAKFRGTVAAGEHVSVAIQNDDGEGGEFIEDVSTLRLRVVNPCNGKTLAIFPEPVPEGETPETWDSDLTPLTCTLNLNTVQMLKAVPPAANMPLLFVLDDYDNNTLYFKEQFEVTHWPRLRGEEEPTDLDNYKDLIEDFRERIDAAEGAIRDAVDEANGIVAHVDAAKTVAQESAAAAGNSASAAQASETAARDANTSAQNAKAAAQASEGKAAESASLATRAAIAKMRERTGSRLWHNVALSQNENSQWVMDVDQDPGEGDGAFDADVQATGSTTPRSLARRFSEVVNVKDFGAKGDNSTDDTAAIRAAVEAARYKTLYFPNGNYIVSGKITVDTTIRMTGDSSYSSNIRTNTHNITMLEFTANGSVVLENLSFLGPQHWSSEEHGGTLVAFAPTTGENQGSRIRNCRFTYGVVGLDLRRNQQCFITHCGFSQFRLIGIRCNNEYNGDSGDSVISECTISSKRKDYSEDFSNYTYGILQYGSGGLRIINNKILGVDLGVEFLWRGKKIVEGVVSEVGTAILLIGSNSIEHCFRAVRIKNDLTTKGFANIIITGNEITVPISCYGIEIAKEASKGGKIRGITIADNSFHLDVDNANTTYPENLSYSRQRARGILIQGGEGIFVGTNMMCSRNLGIQQQDATYISTPFSIGVIVSKGRDSEYAPQNVTIAKQTGIGLANECSVASEVASGVKFVGVSEVFTATGTTGGEPDDGGWYATDEITHTFDIPGGFAKTPTVVATPNSDGCRCYVASKSATACSVVILSKEPTASVSAEVVAMC